MRAVCFSKFGGPEVLEVQELPVPVPGPGEVRIKVAAAAVNPTDTGMRAGGRAEALAAFEPPWVAGMDAAGVVDEVGPGVDWQVGDEVMAVVLPMSTGRGAQCESIVVPAASVARIPAGASLVEASTLPMNALTVRRALDLLDLKPGQTLAVTGAAGAVGGYAIQLGKVDGLRILGDASPKDEALVRELGADVVVPRGPDVAKAFREAVPEGVDGLIDAALIGPPVLAAIRDGGALAVVRPFQGETERGITVHRVAVSDYAKNSAALDRLRELVEQGAVTLRVAETFPPEKAGEAQEKLAAGGVRGRMVITF
ncbi:MAG: NADP-dependent oxidoreductase [Acidimicrobiaceae bacterium]|nr:NADP-dependent oxidoreductase [Acidimicrobiaceae bacterium]